MAGINLQGGAGAGAAVDELHRILAERFREEQEKNQVTQEQNRLAELARQADQRNAVDLGHLGVSRDTAGLAREKFGYDVGRDKVFDPLKVREMNAGIAGTEANTANTLQQTQQGGMKFDWQAADRAALQKTIEGMQPGPTKTAVDLNRLGVRVPVEDLMDPTQLGQRDAARATAAWQGGGQQVFTDKERIQAANSPAMQQGTDPSALKAVTATKPDPATANIPDKVTGLTPNAVYQSGIAYALQGSIPAMGMGSNPNVRGARSAIINQGAALAAAAGVDLATLRADYRANSGALAKLVPVYMATDAALETADRNLKLALDQSPRVSRTGSPIVNRFAQWAGGHTLTGDPELTKLETYIYTAAREYAKVTSGSAASVQGLTDTATREANHLLNAAQTPEAFQAAIQAMRDDMQNVKSSYLNRINQTSSTIANFLSSVTYTPFEAVKREEPPPAGSGAGAVAEGTQKEIPGIPGGMAEYRGGKWIRIK